MTSKFSVNYRKESLIKLLHCITTNEKKIINALYADFKKPVFEAIVTETSYVISDLKDTINSIHSLTKPKKVWPSLLNFPSTDYIYKEPYGAVLIIAPWNYPFQLALCPLIAAIAAGNQVILKPSELTPNTSKIISEIISTVFESHHAQVVEGGVATATQLLEQRWDYIFFTGSVAVGKIIAKAAAVHMTPITLELGGKNPCIVDETANLRIAAKRIVWGKFMNAGQTCIAPDYLLINSQIKNQLVSYLIEEIIQAYGNNPNESSDYCRIVDSKNWDRLHQLLENETILFGGDTNRETTYFGPTLIDEPALNSEVMKDEIFGPILPLLTYTSEEEIKTIISKYEKPLALYVFSENKKFADTMITHFAFGGGCINDTMIHFSNKRLPFGGVGFSGIGSYHGKKSFNVFSHKKAIVKKATWLDIPLRYAPYKNKIEFVKKILRWF